MPARVVDIRDQDLGTAAAGADAGAGAPRVTFVTDIPTPYMLEVLDALGRRCALSVVFCGASAGRAMPWSLRPHELSFEAAFVRGWQISRGVDASDWHLSPKILHAVARSHPEAIITAGFSVPSLYAALYSRFREVPFLIYSDGTSDTERSLSRIQRIARSVLMPRAAAGIALSVPAARRFAEVGEQNVFLAPHSSRLEPLWEVARGRRYQRGSALRVLSVSRLIERKGIDRLIQAVGIVAADAPEISLSLVGSGTYEAALRDLADAEAPGLVFFEGFVEPDRLAPHFASADVFAYPSLHDPFGIAVLEAAASGLPIVSSPHAGVTEDLIEDGRSGLVADPAKPEEFAAALRALAADAELRERLGREAHDRSRSRTPEAAAEGYLRAVRFALGGRCGG